MSRGAPVSSSNSSQRQGAGRLLVHAGRLIGHGPSEQREMGILIEHGRVAAVDRFAAFAGNREIETVGDSEAIALPGLINTHSHGRGISTCNAGLPDRELEEWCVSLFAAPSADPYIETVWFCRKLLLNGITTVLQMHSTGTSQPDAYEQELRSILSAYRDCGVTVFLAPDLRDRGLPVAVDEDGFRRTLSPDLRQRVEAAVPGCPPAHAVFDVISAVKTDIATGRYGESQLILGPVGQQWCSRALLETTARFATAEGLPVHMHLLQTSYDRELGERRFDGGVLHGLAHLGLLNTVFSAAHGVLLDRAECEFLAETGASVVVCPSSCLRVLGGMAPVADLLEAGVNIAVGVDSMGLAGREDVLAEARLLSGLTRFGQPGSPWLDASTAFRICSTNGGRALGRPELGTLNIGAPGDVVLIDPRRLDPYLPSADTLTLVMGSASPAAIDTVVAGGRVMVRDGDCVIPAIQPDYSGPSEEAVRLVAELLPLVRAHYERWMVAGAIG